MPLQLTEGQDFAGHYTLLSRISTREGKQNWLAIDNRGSERVCLKIYTPPLPDNVVAALDAAIRRTRGLIHPHIVRTLSIESGADASVIACQYVARATQFVPDRTLANISPVINQLFGAIQFAHGLGIAHGHLHPGNLLVDDAGLLMITDFCLPTGLQADDAFSHWLSPQVRSGAAADISDDIYSIGQLLFVCLTGREWRPGDTFESTSHIQSQVKRLVTAMLSSSPWERPTNLADAKEVIQQQLTGDDPSRLDPATSFSRPRPEALASARLEMPSAHRPPRERLVVPARLVYQGVGVLVLLAILVFVFAPQEADTERTPATIAPTPLTSPPKAVATAQDQPSAGTILTPLETAKRKQLEADGEQIATELLRVQLNLEDAGVHLWAQKEFEEAVQRTGDADAAYRDERFEEALAIYQQSLSVLIDLRDGMDEVKVQSSARGSQALLAMDSATAIKAFTIVTAIDPADEAAKAQLERALNLDDVLVHVNEGEMLMTAGRLDEARQKFLTARGLDPDFGLVTDSLREVDRRIAARDFGDAMSEALTALGNKEFERAREQFERAAKILPNSTEPRDGLQQVANAVLSNRITELLGQAESHVAEEAWGEAAEVYRQIQALDATLLLATEGLALARERITLDEELKRFLADPALLMSDEELDAAKRWLVTATRTKPQGERIKQQIDRLSNYIALARIPVKVQLNSDGLTEVMVYRVGNLGRINSTTLELVPGNYRIVGTRRGYRDVEVALTIQGGRGLDPIYVSCTEQVKQ